MGRKEEKKSKFFCGATWWRISRLFMSTPYLLLCGHIDGPMSMKLGLIVDY
jgi:hypothetical protein